MSHLIEIGKVSKYSMIRHTEIKKLVNRDVYKLRKAIQAFNGADGTSFKGSSLNPNQLSNTFIAVKNNRDNPNRMRNFTINPKESMAVSFAIDNSGSMSRPLTKSNEKPYTYTNFTEVCYAMDAMIRAFDMLKIKSEASLVCFETRTVADTRHIISHAVRFKKPSDRWNDDMLIGLMKNDVWTGTCVDSYANVAIESVKRMNATHKVAFLLTDYSDGERIHEIAHEAKALHNINLVCIGVAPSRTQLRYYEQNLPNCVVGIHADKICRKVIPKIIEVLKK